MVLIRNLEFPLDKLTCNESACSPVEDSAAITTSQISELLRHVCASTELGLHAKLAIMSRVAGQVVRYTELLTSSTTSLNPNPAGPRENLSCPVKVEVDAPLNLAQPKTSDNSSCLSPTSIHHPSAMRETISRSLVGIPPLERKSLSSNGCSDRPLLCESTISSHGGPSRWFKSSIPKEPSAGLPLTVPTTSTSTPLPMTQHLTQKVDRTGPPTIQSGLAHLAVNPAITCTTAASVSSMDVCKPTFRSKEMGVLSCCYQQCQRFH
ncbi:unnamed protein product [Echinostoma caproni]|uniref:Uncharacterized protein n=1 Tax=Echinostoma caproni TaxID=27848 RepID=A0A183AP51_9TREM|nr:unnamed protein product [Echinostoma caproni]